MFQARDKVGDYEIVAKLKSGGMATLFLGKRTGAAGFSRHVAIKFVHEHLASDATFVRMFVDEALLSSKIHHPNVVHVEELKKVNGRYFLVMEYVHGCSLGQLMSTLGKRQRTMRPELAAYVAVKVAEGLHAAHTATDSDGMPLGVVHRDVSPQNVLLAYKGHVKLIDFGVAKAEGRAQQTTGGSLKGKIRYMSPEQAFGKPVDARTDVYALGIVLWEMLTGRRAFSGDNELLLLDAVRNPNIPFASFFNPAVPETLDQVIAKAIAKEPEDRYPSAQELRKALARAIPSALALDDSDLERLVTTVMADTIERDLAQLPESVSGVAFKMTGVSGEELVQTLTVSAAGLTPPSEPSIPSIEEVDHVAATEVSAPGGYLEAESRSPGELGPTRAPAALDPAEPTPLARATGTSRPVMWALVGLICIGLASLGGVVAVLAFSPEQDITATELGRGPARSDVEAPDPATPTGATLEDPTLEDPTLEDPATGAEATPSGSSDATGDEARADATETETTQDPPGQDPPEQGSPEQGLPEQGLPEQGSAPEEVPQAEVTRPGPATPAGRRRAGRRAGAGRSRNGGGGVFLTDEF